MRNASTLTGGSVFYFKNFIFHNFSIHLHRQLKSRAMKGRMILAIITAIVALALTIWCFIDGTYYIGAFALCICIAQVCNYFLIKKKRY